MAKKEGHLSSPDAQARHRALEKSKRVQDENDLRSLMATPWGRRIAWRLIDEWGGLQHVTYPGSDAEFTFRHEGRRMVGMEFYVELKRVTPTELSQGYVELMQAEAEEAIRRKATTSEAEESTDVD